MLWRISRTDARLRELLEEAREYADIYSLARQRQRGCDGMGDLAMIKEEFEEALNSLTAYCKEKGYLLGDITIGVDSAVEGLAVLAKGGDKVQKLGS